MNHYEAKQEARRQRLLDLSARLEAEGNARYKRARALADVIPFGQPILVGHHSEGRDRRYREKIHQNFGKAFAALKESEDAARRAAAVGTGGISSDDPEAVVKLRAELAEHEAQHKAWKAINTAHKAYKAGKPNWAAGISAAQAELVTNYVPAYSWEPHPIPPYRFSNHSANMRRIKERIAALERQATVVAAMGGESKVTECKGYEVIENLEENRLQLAFPGKPSQAVRSLLKSSGFRWSPTAGRWQRMLSGFAYHVTSPDGYLRKQLEAAA